MKLTQHYRARLSQRGITSAMADLVLRYGEIDKDKYVISKKLALELVAEFRQLITYWQRSKKSALFNMNAIQIEVIDQTLAEIKILIKIADTNGLAIVECENTLITAYKLYC